MKHNIFKNSYALFVGLGLVTLTLILSACANEEVEIVEKKIELALSVKTSDHTGFSETELVLQPTGSTIGSIRIDLAQNMIEVPAEMLGTVTLVSASEPDITVEGTTRRGNREFTFSDSQVATAVWKHIYDLATEKGWIITSVEYADYEKEDVSEGVVRITLHFIVTVSGSEVKTFTMSPSYYQYVKGAEIPDLFEESQEFTVNASVANNGITSTANILGKGTIYHTTVDAKSGEKSVKEFPFTGTATASVSLSKDTCWVEAFGVELVSTPTPANKDLTNGNTVGQETTMATWKWNDGQTASGLVRWAYEKVAEASGTPHVVVENLRYNPAGTKVKKINENTAWVTMSFLVDYHTEDAKTSTSDQLEMLVTYVQAIPAPEVEEPKGPTYSWNLNFTFKQGKGSKPDKLLATMEVTSSDNGHWTYEWTAATCGRYEDIEVLYVSGTNIVKEVRKSEFDASKASNDNLKQEGALWEVATRCLSNQDIRHFPTTAGGEVGPEEMVFFYTTDVVFNAPTGEKIEVRLHPETVFEKDNFGEKAELKGKVLTASGDEYTYSETLTMSAKHYISCTVTENGAEKPFEIGCLNSGLFKANTCLTNLYVR